MADVPGRPNPNLIQTGAGYSVEVGRTGLRYVAGERSMLVDSEVLVGPVPAIALDAASIKGWDPPHDGEPVDDQDRQRIIEDIELAFASKGWVLRVTWPFGELRPDGTWHSSTEGRTG